MKPEDIKVGGRIERKIGTITAVGTVLGVSTEHDAVWIKWDGAGYPTSHDLTALARQVTPSRGEPPLPFEPYILKRIGRIGRPNEAPYSYGTFASKKAALDRATRSVRNDPDVTMEQFYIVDLTHREWLV